jgi:GYF domain 2
MGIRFRCPNGHKLNVKSFLAGKRGVCPDCGQTFRIPPDGTDDSGVIAMPLESRRNGSDGGLRNGSARGGEDNLEESDFETAVAVAAAAVTEPSPAAAEGVVFLPPMPAPQTSAAAAPVAPADVQLPTALAPSTTSKPASPAPSGSGPAGAPPVVPEIYFPASPAVPAAVRPTPAVAGPATTSPAFPPAPNRADPIAESPNAVWYVRPPSGGQYGPARGDVMRKWIAEGRVSSDSLVWREGWTDWRDAGQLFPALATSPHSGAAVPAQTGLPPIPNNGAAAVRASPLRPADRNSPGKRKNNDLAVAALVCLVLVCLILVTVLVVVLSQGSA